MIHSADDSHTSSLEQVLILDHIVMLLKFLKHGTEPQGTNHTGVDDVDNRDIVAGINGLLKIYGKYGE